LSVFSGYLWNRTSGKVNPCSFGILSLRPLPQNPDEHSRKDYKTLL
jgi:hypothetical protein